MNRGFTLLELIISVGIVLVLTGIGVANYRIYTDKETLRQTVATIKSDLRLAQTKAIAGQKPVNASCTELFGYKVSFSTSSYTIVPDCTEGISSADALVITLPNGMTFAESLINTSFLFYPLSGGTSLSDDLVLQVTLGAQALTITVTQGGLITE